MQNRLFGVAAASATAIAWGAMRFLLLRCTRSKDAMHSSSIDVGRYWPPWAHLPSSVLTWACSKGDLAGILRSGSLIGDLEIVAGVACFALYSAYSSSFKEMSWLRFTTLSLGLGTIASVIATAFVTLTGIVPVPHPTLDAQFIWEIAYMAIIAAIVGFACWNYAIRALGPQNTILFMNGVSIVTFNVLSRPKEEATQNRVASKRAGEAA